MPIQSKNNKQVNLPDAAPAVANKLGLNTNKLTTSSATNLLNVKTPTGPRVSTSATAQATATTSAMHTQNLAEQKQAPLGELVLYYYSAGKNGNVFGHLAVGDFKQEGAKTFFPLSSKSILDSNKPLYLSFTKPPKDNSNGITYNAASAFITDEQKLYTEPVAIRITGVNIAALKNAIDELGKKDLEGYAVLSENCATFARDFLIKAGVIKKEQCEGLIPEILPSSIAKMACNSELAKIDMKRQAIINDPVMHPSTKIKALIQNDIERLQLKITRYQCGILESHKSIPDKEKKIGILQKALADLKGVNDYTVITQKLLDVKKELSEVTRFGKNETGKNLDACFNFPGIQKCLQNKVIKQQEPDMIKELVAKFASSDPESKSTNVSTRTSTSSNSEVSSNASSSPASENQDAEMSHSVSSHATTVDLDDSGSEKEFDSRSSSKDSSELNTEIMEDDFEDQIFTRPRNG